MTSKPQRELLLQNHIIHSYKLAGGYAMKWSSEWQKGPPDLICALPEVSIHLMEVKHVPTFKKGSSIKNPMTPSQKLTCKKYHEFGGQGRVFLGLVGGHNADTYVLYVFSSMVERCDTNFLISIPYVKGQKFNMTKLRCLW